MCDGVCMGGGGVRAQSITQAYDRYATISGYFGKDMAPGATAAQDLANLGDNTVFTKAFFKYIVADQSKVNRRKETRKLLEEMRASTGGGTERDLDPRVGRRVARVLQLK